MYGNGDFEGLGGVMDWVNAPFDALASVFVSTPPVIGITPQTQTAIASQYVKSGIASDPKASLSSAKASSAMTTGNWNEAGRIIANYTQFGKGEFDRLRDSRLPWSGSASAGTEDWTRTAVIIGVVVVGGLLVSRLAFGGRS